MRDPFANYDAWLERPYQDMIDADDDFLDWADMEGYDLDDPVELVKAQRYYEEYLEACAEEDALNRYEAHLDRLEMEAEEREYEEDWSYNDY